MQATAKVDRVTKINPFFLDRPGQMDQYRCLDVRDRAVRSCSLHQGARCGPLQVAWLGPAPQKHPVQVDVAVPIHREGADAPLAPAEDPRRVQRQGSICLPVAEAEAALGVADEEVGVAVAVPIDHVRRGQLRGQARARAERVVRAPALLKRRRHRSVEVVGHAMDDADDLRQPVFVPIAERDGLLGPDRKVMERVCASALAKQTAVTRVLIIFDWKAFLVRDRLARGYQHEVQICVVVPIYQLGELVSAVESPEWIGGPADFHEGTSLVEIKTHGNVRRKGCQEQIQRAIAVPVANCDGARIPHVLEGVCVATPHFPVEAADALQVHHKAVRATNHEVFVAVPVPVGGAQVMQARAIHVEVSSGHWESHGSMNFAAASTTVSGPAAPQSHELVAVGGDFDFAVRAIRTAQRPELQRAGPRAVRNDRPNQAMKRIFARFPRLQMFASQSPYALGLPVILEANCIATLIRQNS
mmetsp:Transcript_29982/g.90753  ORF Transcript_29982/g.90753 Transcript_29982/m.90753 type:complete len:472 (+) Transcript_29982:1500-2915(+)